MTQGRSVVLLAIARAAIANELGSAVSACEDAPWLATPGATFVTLRKHGALRGCIGSLEAYRPLLVDLKANALAAAFRDPRFAPLQRDELGEVRIEVSLLSLLQPIECTSEADALARLKPFEDGVVLQCGAAHGTFLPQVWADLPEPALFLRELKRKAGLPASFWESGIRLSRYSVAKYAEDDVAVAPLPA
ncbi:MAG TPA: AmmeMemoRadiSam system protein A [Burkholderiales bacterium]|nr:AmmeMemoRadiSam system protein A [Betaproteobacteria bacterium]HQR52507.1 AmmeMemoRadiSam system protein A [Burkholderiales bacterium]